MAHILPGFPDFETSLGIAQALQEAGVAFLEVQFPYSDPAADGPDIQGAAAIALESGFTVRKGWEFVGELSRGAGAPPVFAMAYAGMVYARGVERFVQDAADAGAYGLIVPDLMPWSDEGLFRFAREKGVHAVPVITVQTPENRMAQIHELGVRYIYVSLRVGITGRFTEIAPDQIEFVQRLTNRGYRVLAGFGITSAPQVRTIAPHIDAAIVGSALVRTIRDAPAGTERIAAAQFIATLCNG